MVHIMRDSKNRASSPDSLLPCLKFIGTPADIRSFYRKTSPENVREVIASLKSHPKINLYRLKKHVTTKAMDKSSLAVTLGVRIDKIIFQNTFKRIGGISLFAIKKHLNAEYHYNTHRYRRLIRNYVVESLVNGNLQQASGKGANGSVRLSSNKHRKFARARAQH